jgi:ankyrin repeat protein
VDREDKITPLHIAVQFPDIGLAKKLVEAKANVHSTTIGDRRVKKKS